MDCYFVPPRQFRILAAVADPVRWNILVLLHNQPGRTSYREIISRFAVSPSVLSRHMRILEKSGLVIREKEGKHRVVVLAPGACAAIRAALPACDGRC